MRCVKVDAPRDWGDVRGPDLVRWITDADLRFDGIENIYKPPSGHILGALSHAHWVVFHGLQVIQVIHDEVHSAWHYEYRDENEEFVSAWKIENSEWIKSFHPRHLDSHAHFIIRFYDDVIEVICKDLFFGTAPFDLASAIEAYPKMAFPYYQLASSREKLGDVKGAIENFEKYQNLIPNITSKEIAKRAIEVLRSR